MHEKPLAEIKEEIDESITHSGDCETLSVPNNFQNCKSERACDTIQHPKSNSKSEKIDASSYNFYAEDSSTLRHPISLQELASWDLSLVPRWMKETMTCNEEIILRFFFNKCIKTGDYFESFVLKEMIVKADMTFQIRILGRLLGVPGINIDFSPIYTIQRLQDLLVTLNNSNICHGLKSLSVPDHGFGSTVCRDFSGSWRHVRCCLLLSKTSVCPFCQRERKTITTRLRRARQSADNTQNIRL